MSKLKNFIKNRYKDIIIIGCFIITYLIIHIYLTKNGTYIFASSKDFDVQHYLLPEYLREIFINTHNLFPKFSFNLAAGTNIYNLAYYGLYNPIILISFLFPKIKMLNYIIFAMGCIVVLSTSLLYFYFRKNNYSYLTSFICSFMFLCSGPLIFHSHRHIMFIDYFPFLILGFFGTDIYIKNKKSLLLIISIFLMILTSYFYSVAGLVVLFIYGIYRYLKIHKKIKYNNFTKYIVGLILRYIPAILTAAFLLIPTAFALLNGRASGTDSNIFKELFTIKNNLFYQSYTMGLTLFSLFSMIYVLFKDDRANRFLSIILLICSFISFPSFILNGFLYADGKSLIPFIPLVIILVAEVFEKVIYKTKFKYIVMIYLIISSFTMCLIANNNDKLIPKNSIDFKEEEIYRNKINNIIDNNDIYRIKNDLIAKDYINRITSINEYKTTSYLSSNNKIYNDAYKYSFDNPLQYRNSMMYSSSNNLLFEMYMGEKYIFTKNNYNNIYHKIDSYKDVNIYENDYVLPMGYATNNYINKNDFNKLKYPDTILNSLGVVVSDNKTNVDIKKAKEIYLNYQVIEKKNLTYEKSSDGYKIKSKSDGSLKLKTDEEFDNKLLIIQFELDDKDKCMYNDLSIQINSIMNVLTCKNWKYYNDNRVFTYTISENPEVLDIIFEKGTYNIHNIKLYTIDYDDIIYSNKNVYPMIIDKNKSNNEVVTGNISVLKDSYFTISIPNDKGLLVKLDNKMVEYDLTNGSFVGFPIKEGEHIIEISYIPRGYNLGIIISIIGLLSFISVLIYERR